MCAVVTKIPHLVYEEDLLKTQKRCIILITIYGLCTMDMMETGEKTPKIYIYEKPMKNSPFGVPPIPTSIKFETDCFPGRKNRKQAGPNLIYRDKSNKGFGAVWVNRSR